MSRYKIVARTTSGTIHVLERMDRTPGLEELAIWEGRIDREHAISVDFHVDDEGRDYSDVRVLTRHIEALEIQQGDPDDAGARRSVTFTAAEREHLAKWARGEHPNPNPPPPPGSA